VDQGDESMLADSAKLDDHKMPEWWPHEGTAEPLNLLSKSDSQSEDQAKFEKMLTDMQEEERRKSEEEEKSGSASLLQPATEDENAANARGNSHISPKPATKKYYSWSAVHPHRSLMSEHGPCCGWSSGVTFWAFPSNVPGAQRYYAWDALSPHRGLLQKASACCGWRNSFSFYAFPSYQPGTTRYYVWWATNPHRGLISTSHACCGWTNGYAFYAYKNNPGKVQLCTEITKVTGYWVKKHTVAGRHTETWTYGTTNTKSKSETRAFSTAFEVGVKASAEVEFTGVKFGSEVSTSVRTEWSKSFTTERTTSYSESKTVSFTPEQKFLNHQVWVYEFTSEPRCGPHKKTTTREYAYSKDPRHGPCCFPGFCKDLTSGSCNVCTAGFLLDKKDSRCREEGSATSKVLVSNSHKVCDGIFTAVGSGRYTKKYGSHTVELWWQSPWWRCSIGRGYYALWRSNHKSLPTQSSAYCANNNGGWRHCSQSKAATYR